MTLANIKTGDLVEVDKKGRRFYALVDGRGANELDIMPVCPGISYRHATAREIVGHWHRSRVGRARAVRRAQAASD